MSCIAVCVDLSPAQTEHLSRQAEGYRLQPGGSLAGCEIAFGNPAPEALAGAESLRWIQLESVGFGEYSGLDWADLGNRLTLTNLAGFFAEPVAETALAGILSLTRGLNRLATLQAERHWVGDPIRTGLRLLGGARVVMLGYGSVNRRLAELLTPFGCKVVPLCSGSTREQLDAALPSADILVAAVPDTPQTRGLLNADRLALLPSKAVIVNLGRGTLVDEAALCDALVRGRLAGAVLDVTQEEPLPSDHPLWTTPNTLLTQHSAGGTMDEMDRKIDVFVDNLMRYRQGRDLLGVADLKRGY